MVGNVVVGNVVVGNVVVDDVVVDVVVDDVVVVVVTGGWDRAIFTVRTMACAR